MNPDLLTQAAAAVFTALIITAAVYDFIQRRIPNWTVVALLALFVPCAILGIGTASWVQGLPAFAIALVGTGALYLTGGFGAGDSKLFSAAALFAGLSNLLMLFAATAAVGGVMAIGVLIMRPRSVLRGMTARGRAEAGGRGIPYGVAIAAGAMVVMGVRAFLPAFHIV